MSGQDEYSHTPSIEGGPFTREMLDDLIRGIPTPWGPFGPPTTEEQIQELQDQVAGLKASVRHYEGRLRHLEFVAGIWPVFGVLAVPPAVTLERAVEIIRRWLP